METGCARKDHGLLAWGDDGCSSFFFDIFTRQNNGKLISVDIEEKNVNHTNTNTSDRVQVFCSDSVKFLSKFDNPDEIDLLYLDSYDFDPNNPAPSQNHHLKEITAIYAKLQSGCMILVDDAGIKSESGVHGKAGEVFRFMTKEGVKPKILSYQILWVKP